MKLIEDLNNENSINDKFDILNLLELNIQDEDEAIKGYTDFMRELELLDLNIVNELIPEIKEIISDEMNHKAKLNIFYQKISGILPNKD
jgi:hypothetical protein